jgi:hypothetical protein
MRAALETSERDTDQRLGTLLHVGTVRHVLAVVDGAQVQSEELSGALDEKIRRATTDDVAQVVPLVGVGRNLTQFERTPLLLGDLSQDDLHVVLVRRLPGFLGAED